MRTAIFIADNHILRNIHQTTSQITGVRRPQCGVGKALSCTTGRNEVFQYVQSLAVIRPNRHFNRGTGRVGNQSAHTGKLANLVDTTTRAGVRHHEDGVVLVQSLLKRLGNFVRGVVPNFDKLLGFFLAGNIAAFKLAVNFIHQRICLGKNLLLCLGNFRIADGNGNRRLGGVFKAQCLDFIQHLRSRRRTVNSDAALDNLRELFVVHKERNLQIKLLFGIGSVHIAQILRDHLVEDQPANGCIDQLGNFLIANGFGNPHLNRRVQGNRPRIVSHQSLVRIAENLAFADFSLAFLFQREIIRTQHHILCRNRHRATVRGLQQIVRGKHQETCFRLCLCGQGNVHCHLVAVKVGIIRRTHQRVKLERSAFNQYRFKRLNTQTVQSRRTVEQNGVSLNDIFQRIPDLWLCAVHHFSGRFNINRRRIGVHKTFHYKGLEQLQCHFFRQAALIHFQFRANDDNGTAGVVHTLAQQVLPEPSLLTL